MIKIQPFLLALCLYLSGCEAPTTGRYSILADNNVAIKQLGITNIGIGQFTAPTDFSPQCRAVGFLEIADNLTHTQYIQRAFEDELKVAGVFAQSSPRVSLSGSVTKLDFSSMRAVVGGSWTIDLDLKSSNGSQMIVSEYYEFSSGFLATEACRQTAEAFRALSRI